MRRRVLPPETLPARRAMRAFVAIDLAYLAGTLAWLILSIDLLLGLMLGLAACAWLMADMGCWDLDVHALRFRRILSYLGMGAAASRAFLYHHDWSRFGIPFTWLWGGQVVTGLPAIVTTTWALRVLARVRQGPPGSGPLPPAGPTAQFPCLTLNPPGPPRR